MQSCDAAACIMQAIYIILYCVVACILTPRAIQALKPCDIQQLTLQLRMIADYQHRWLIFGTA